MSSDAEIPISQSFIELMEQVKNNEIVGLEQQWKLDQMQRQDMRKAQGTMNAAEAFEVPEEEVEDRKKKAEVMAEMDRINKAVAQTLKDKEKEKQKDATSEEDAFPPPPTS